MSLKVLCCWRLPCPPDSSKRETVTSQWRDQVHTACSRRLILACRDVKRKQRTLNLSIPLQSTVSATALPTDWGTAMGSEMLCGAQMGPRTERGHDGKTVRYNSFLIASNMPNIHFWILCCGSIKVNNWREWMMGVWEPPALLPTFPEIKNYSKVYFLKTQMDSTHLTFFHSLLAKANDDQKGNFTTSFPFCPWSALAYK